jgi:methionyl-tRNA synthetase
MPYAQDGTISYENIIARYNSELANTLGNLVNRSVAMVNKYFDGEVVNSGYEDEFSKDLKACVKETVAKVTEKMNEFKVSDALGEIFTLLRRSNKYIDETTPWVLAKNEEDKEKLQAVLYNLIETIRICGVLLKSFMPDTAENMLKQINASVLTYESILEFGATENGTKVGEAVPLFARPDEANKMEEISLSLEKEEEIPEVEFKDEIEFGDFEKLDLRVAKVKNCEKVEKADKLLKFTLDVAGKERTIVSGIAKYYKPEELIGKNVVIIANLKPVKLRGILSEGMILSSDDNGKIKIVEIDGEVNSGAIIC